MDEREFEPVKQHPLYSKTQELHKILEQMTDRAAILLKPELSLEQAQEASMPTSELENELNIVISHARRILNRF